METNTKTVLTARVDSESRHGSKLTIRTGPELFRFESHAQWVNKSTSWFSNSGVRGEDCLCVDALGRVCPMGRHFNIAENDNAFPVVVYLNRQDEADCPNFGQTRRRRAINAMRKRFGR